MRPASDNPLNPRLLETFTAVIENGSVTGAARLLGRSQSAVTRVIQELEAFLGFQVIRRAGPRISPTEQGLMFYEEARQLLQSFRHAEACARAIEQVAPRPLEIACVPSLSVSLVPRALASIAPSLLPDRVSINTVAAERIVQEVVSRTADYGVSSFPFQKSDVAVHWIGEAPCVAVVRADHFLATRATIKLKELAGERLLTLSSRLREAIDGALATEAVEVGSVFHSGASSTVLAMAGAGLGLAIVDPATAYGLPLDGLMVKPLDYPIPFVFGGFSRAGRPIPPTVAALNDAMLEHASAMLPGFRLQPAAG